MAIELKMPALSPTMDKGTLAKWLVAEGDSVKPGDLIAEIETDKATMELEAVDAGIITRLIVPEGTDDVVVGSVIAVMADEDTLPEPGLEEAIARGVGATEPMSASPVVPATTPALPHASGGDAVRSRRAPADRTKVSPLALRIAEARNIDLDTIIGSGPDGRIVRADLRVGSLLAQSALPAFPPTGCSPPPTGVPVTTSTLSLMRRTIARRLSESKQTVPPFYLTVRCNLDSLLKLRGELNLSLAERGVKLCVNDMLIKALALALTEVPDANVQFGGEELYRFSRVDVSMAVAIEGGLITPIIRDVASLSLSAIAQASKALVAKAREGKLALEDYQGGTASISNLGMFGVDEMFPVINPPQALILGIGAGVEQPWKIDGALGLATIMAATAAFDHRAIDGATAAQFVTAFRTIVEAPMLIVG